MTDEEELSHLAAYVRKAGTDYRNGMAERDTMMLRMHRTGEYTIRQLADLADLPESKVRDIVR